MLPVSYIKSLNSWFVSAYKVFGFFILGALVLGMGGFLGLNAFFLVNHSWIVPTILDPHHEKVIQVNLGFLEQVQRAEKLQAERIAIESELKHIQYAIKLQEQFQKNFLLTLTKEQDRHLKSLLRLKKLNQDYRQHLNDDQTDTQLNQLTAQQVREQFENKLIGKEELLRGQMLSQQQSFSALSKKEREEDLHEKLDLTERELKAQKESRDILASRLLSDSETMLIDPELLAKERKSMSFDSLQKEQQFLQAEIAKSELLARMAPLQMQIKEIDNLIADHARMLKNLSDSPYIQAAQEPVTIAFVSYDNLPQVQQGSSVIGCYLGILLCKKTGEIKKIYSGEMTVKHPMSNRDIRGVLVEIKLADNRWATERALMVNRAPLLF